MGYQFKLEALRRYRQHQEDLIQKALADAVREVETAQVSLDEHLALKKKTEQEFEAHQDVDCTGPKAAMYRLFMNQLAERIDHSRETLAACRRHFEETRADLLEAMKKRKAIDKLKENEFLAYIRELNREEAKFIDEMAINRFSLTQS